MASVSNPFDHLEEDHRSAEDLFDKLDDTTENAGKTREQYFEKLNDALTLHAELEEQVLYPELEHLQETHEITEEAFEEHHVLKMLLKELAAMPAGSEQWKAKLTVLEENFNHHVEEEEADMFKKAREALDDEQTEQLGKKMEEFLMHY